MKFWSEMMLAHRVRRGDADACARLVRDHHPAVYRFLLHLCRDRHIAEDLTQETFATAWLKADAYGGLASLATWLHRIAYRKFVDWQRSADRSVVLGRVDGLGRRDACAGPLERVAAMEWSHRLYRAVHHLDAPAREVVVLHYFQGLSYREMALVLGEPAGTVKWRISEALQRLRSLIHESANGETTDNVRVVAAAGVGAGRATPAVASAAGAGGS